MSDSVGTSCADLYRLAEGRTTNTLQYQRAIYKAFEKPLFLFIKKKENAVTGQYYQDTAVP